MHKDLGEGPSQLTLFQLRATMVIIEGDDIFSPKQTPTRAHAAYVCVCVCVIPMVQ